MFKDVKRWLAAPVKTADEGRALLKKVKGCPHLEKAIRVELGDLLTDEQQEEIDCLCQALDRWQP